MKSKIANFKGKRNELEMLILCCEKVLRKQTSGGVISERGTDNEMRMSYTQAIECLSWLGDFFISKGERAYGICVDCRYFKIYGDNGWGQCVRTKTHTHRYESCDKHYNYRGENQ